MYVSLKFGSTGVKVLDRGGKIEVLVDKSETLRNQVLSQPYSDLFYPPLFFCSLFEGVVVLSCWVLANISWLCSLSVVSCNEGEGCWLGRLMFSNGKGSSSGARCGLRT